MKISFSLANSLSLFRIIIAPPIAWSISTGCWLTASLLLTLAILSDVFDGPLARKKGQDSSFGGLLDHSCDALLVTILLFALTETHNIPVLLPILVLVSFIQYVVDSRAISGHRLRTSLLGRYNGIGYFVLAALCIYSSGLEKSFFPESFFATCAWILIFSTLLSMFDRFWTLISKQTP